MKEYLRSASSRFEKLKEKDYVISPISTVDSEIIVEIIELFNKCGRREVSTILKQYKYLKDEEIRDQLMQCNLDITAKNYEDNGDGEISELLDTIDELKGKLDERTKYIELGRDNIKANLIFGFKTEEHLTGEEVFLGKLILNPVDRGATKIPLYANHTIDCYNEEKFENLVESFKEQMKSAGVEFVKEENEN